MPVQCRQCGQDNPIGRLTCKACGSFLSAADWEARPTLDLTESPLYHGLVSGEECTLVRVFEGQCRGVEAGGVDAEAFAEGLRVEVCRLASFVDGVERTLYPEGLTAAPDLPVPEFLGLFRDAVDAFARAADALAEGLPSGDFAPGLSAAREAGALLARAFNAGELALKSATP